jgi:hypothetical protein
VIEGRSGTKNAVVPDHPALDSRAVLHLNYARQYACMGEVHLMHSLATFGNKLTLLQLDNPKMRAEVFEIDRAYPCENIIF